MIIDTKFNIGQKLWYLEWDDVNDEFYYKSGEIIGIYYNKVKQVLYEINNRLHLEGELKQSLLKTEGEQKMTTAELYEILDDENKKITLKEYQEILYQLKRDVQDEIVKLTKEDITHPKLKWYYGEMTGFQLALDLSEHIEEEQK